MGPGRIAIGCGGSRCKRVDGQAVPRQRWANGAH